LSSLLCAIRGLLLKDSHVCRCGQTKKASGFAAMADNRVRCHSNRDVFLMNAYAMKQYQTVSVHAQVTEADPHRLIQMLMEGGLQRLAQAKGAMEYGNVALKGELIGKAMGIIGGLRDALDKDKGGEIASNL